MHGPIDFIVVGFEGNKFDGSILRELEKAVDEDIIKLVAIKLLTKDADGNMTAIDVTESDDEYVVRYAELVAEGVDVVDQADIDEVSDLLENNTSAGLLVVEQLWAKPLKQAIIDANGVLVAEGRIHPDAAEELVEVV